MGCIMSNGNGKGRKKKEGSKETSRQLELYNNYIAIEPRNRSLRKLAQNYSLSEQYVKGLSARFGWVERALEHDRQMLAKLERKTGRDFVSDRAERIRQIDNQLKVTYKLVMDAAKKISDGDDDAIKIRTIDDMHKMLRSSRELIELEQMITGGIDPGRVTLVQQIQQIFVGLIPENVKKSQINTGG